MIGASTVAVGIPWWALAVLGAVWLVALGLAIAWFTRRPRAVVVLPVVVAVVWLQSVVGGARYLGWAP